MDGAQTTTTPNGVTDIPVHLDLGQKSKSVVNLAAGGELFMSERISLLTGFSTDVSATPKGAIQGTLFNFASATARTASSAPLGVGTHGERGELMVGTELTYGWGHRVAVNSLPAAARIARRRLRHVPGHGDRRGSTSLRALKKVVEDVKKVVNDPTPQKPVLTRVEP